MRWLQTARANGVVVAGLSVLACALTGCLGVNTPGKMEWVKPTTTAPRVGTVYLFRGWQGIYSKGIDDMAQRLTQEGVTAHVYMPEQFPEVAKAMVERYRGLGQHEPICFIGHSRGVDASLLVARELDKEGISVELLVALDSVDEVTVPKNVKLCLNYWMPGYFPGTNLLRGIPLKQAPGSTGVLHNYNVSGEYSHWKGPLTEHIGFDDDPMVQKRIVGNVLDVCPERPKWQASSNTQR
jgi:hypothetical protein